MKIRRSHYVRLAGLTLITALVPGLGQPQATAASKLDAYLAEQRQSAASASDVLVTVNGVPITKEALDTYARSRGVKDVSTLSDQDREILLTNLVDMELLYQEALRTGVLARPEVELGLGMQERLFIAGIILREYLSQQPISDESLKRAYDQQVQRLGGKEYKARHILVKSEDDAKAIIGQLDDGADFAALAKEKSTGPSGPKGGDLGWFARGAMVKPFGDALAKMEPGTYSKSPVQTQFGWHVILLEDEREAQVPPYEALKGKLEKQMRREQAEAYQNELRRKATVEKN